MFAEAALRLGRRDVFMRVLEQRMKAANRDEQFAELYHPMTGEIYGGIQEGSGNPQGLWRATSRQTWSATSFMRLILMGLAGMRFSTEGIEFHPFLPDGIDRLSIENLIYRGRPLDVSIEGNGAVVERCAVNGATKDKALLPTTGSENRNTIAIRLSA
jgi:glycogen debranching enzyme